MSLLSGDARRGHGFTPAYSMHPVLLSGDARRGHTVLAAGGTP